MSSSDKFAGFSLIEVVIAAGIFTVAVTVTLALLPSLARQSIDNTDALAAQRLPEPSELATCCTSPKSV